MERIVSESQSRREPRVGNTMIDQWVLGTGICGMEYRYPGCYFEGNENFPLLAMDLHGFICDGGSGTAYCLSLGCFVT
jgi:hypothetical protein